MLSEAERKAADVIFKLLEHGSTSLATVRDFLRGKGLAHSAGSWRVLFAERLNPRLESGEVTVAELRDLLRDAEECGRQHVFLFQCPPERARLMLDAARIAQVLGDMGLETIRDEPLDLEMPDEPTLVDIREFSFDNRTGLLIKQVETRTTNKFLGIENDTEGNRMKRVYEVSKKRAVNVARVFHDGLLEVRIAAQDNSTKYDNNLRTFLAALDPIVKKSEFFPVFLVKVKAEIWNRRVELADEIRFNTSIAKNDFGTTLHLSTGSYDENLSQDEGSENAIEQFLAGDGEMVGNNVHFIIPSEPVREVHVLISGEANEFAITASCSPEDFNYVCGKIQSLNS